MLKLNFDVKRHFLDNGLEVLTVKKDTQIASVNVGIRVGSLDEKLEEKGIAHFIEHMLFKGTDNRNYEEINDSLELLGGEYNAYTDYAATVYTISCLAEEIKNGVEILGDMIINSSFRDEEIEKERGVILAEIRTSKDDVEDLSFKKINDEAFVKSPLKYDVAGLEENVKCYNKDELKKFYNKYYVPNNAVITIVSSFDHEEALESISKWFSNWEKGEEIKREIIEEKNLAKTIITEKDNIEQSTIVYLYTFYDLDRKYELPLRILNHRLGESANSLLFREVRENRGLAYDIYTNLDMTKNVKTLYIYTAVGEDDIDAARESIEATLDGIKDRSISIGDRDLTLMKKVHKTAVISTLEDPSELCNYILHQSLECEDIHEFVDDMERLNNLDTNKIYEVSKMVLKNPTIHILKSS